MAAAHSGRLTVYGYVSTMPELMAAANVVVTNGAGVTVLEALRTPRPTVAFAPLVGHGTASTTEMVRRNLAVEARNVPELVEQIRRLRTDADLLHSMERAGESWLQGRDLARSLGEIQALYATRDTPAVPGGAATVSGDRLQSGHVQAGPPGGRQASDLDEGASLGIAQGIGAATVGVSLVREPYRGRREHLVRPGAGQERGPTGGRRRVVAVGEHLCPNNRVGRGRWPAPAGP